MSREAVDAAVECILRRDRRLGMHAETAAAWLTAGEGTGMLHQAAVQQFLWWHLPRKFSQHKWARIVSGAAALFEELGLDRYADIVRSPETQEILAGWRRSPQLGSKQFLAAQAASGVEPPDTDLIQWGPIMGPREAAGRHAVERGLEEAIVKGELVPGSKRWKQVAADVCDRTLTASLAELAGQTPLTLAVTERVETWVTTARVDEHRRWREHAARLLLTRIVAPPGAARVVAPMRWLLERAAEGVQLTQSGYLTKQVVLDAVQCFGWWDWEKPPRSEADVPQLGELRDAASSLRLVRRRGRTLAATTKGRRLIADRGALWREVCSTLGGRDAFGQMIAELAGLRLLVSPAIDDELEEAVAPIVVAQGWRAGRGPVDQRHVAHAIGLRLYWWRMLGLVDEARLRWENLQRVGDRKTSLTPEGEASVLAYLRGRATGPRRPLPG